MRAVILRFSAQATRRPSIESPRGSAAAVAKSRCLLVSMSSAQMRRPELNTTVLPANGGRVER